MAVVVITVTPYRDALSRSPGTVTCSRGTEAVLPSHQCNNSLLYSSILKVSWAVGHENVIYVNLLEAVCLQGQSVCTYDFYLISQQSLTTCPILSVCPSSLAGLHSLIPNS